MRSFITSASLLAATLVSHVSAIPLKTSVEERSISSKQIVAYFGQTGGQPELDTYCQDPNIDIIPVGFVTGFPEGKDSFGNPNNGWISTNFGNQCGGFYQNTNIFASCSNFLQTVQKCQNTYNKKILISIGGGGGNYKFQSQSEALEAARQIWQAFGPKTQGYTGPRPFGDNVVDGFDLDLEMNGNAYVYDFANQLRDYMDNSQSRAKLLTAAPQCAIPDSQLSDAISRVAFDMLFVQFYNTPYCSARAGIDSSYGNGFSYNDWVSAAKASPGKPQIYIGLPGSTTAMDTTTNPSFSQMYLDQDDAQSLISKVYTDSYFGGVMVWDATLAKNNNDYIGQIKGVLDRCRGPVTSTSSSSSSTSTTSTTSTTSNTPSTTLTTSTSTSSTSTTSATPTTTSSTWYTSSTTPSATTTTTQTTSLSSIRTWTTSTWTTGTSSRTTQTTSTPSISIPWTAPSVTSSTSTTSSTSSTVPTTTSATASTPGATTTSETSSTKSSTSTAWTTSQTNTGPSETSSKTSSESNIWEPWSTASTSSRSVEPTTQSTSGQSWAPWSTTTSKPVEPTASTSWGPWSTKPTEVYVTSTRTVYVDVCPTGYTTRTATITATVTVTDNNKPTGWPAGPAGLPTGFYTTTTVCSSGCAATPTTVTVTIPVPSGPITKTMVPTASAPAADTGKPSYGNTASTPVLAESSWPSTVSSGNAYATSAPGNWGAWNGNSNGTVNGVKAFKGGAAADQAPATAFSIAVCVVIAVAGLIL